MPESTIFFPAISGPNTLVTVRSNPMDECSGAPAPCFTLAFDCPLNVIRKATMSDHARFGRAG